MTRLVEHNSTPQVALMALAYLWPTSAQEYLPPKIGAGGKKTVPEPTVRKNPCFTYQYYFIHIFAFSYRLMQIDSVRIYYFIMYLILK